MNSRPARRVDQILGWIVPFPLRLRRVRTLSLGLLLLPITLILPGLAAFPYPAAQGAYSDLAVSHYPNTLYVQRFLGENGSLPLWNSAILSGHPLAANPLSGLWYPPGWPALFLPLPLGFNLLSAAHLVWGGAGLYRLLRRQGLIHPAALFGGLAFSLLPKLYAHYGAGHLTLVYAVSWTPWLLAEAGNPIEGRAGAPGSAALPLKAGLLLALITLADPRWAPFAGALWLLAVLLFDRRRPAGRRAAGFVLRRVSFNLLLAALLSAPLALPLLELTRLSTRAQLTAAEVLSFSLPPARLLGLLFPAPGGFHEWTLYPGAVILLLALAALALPARTPERSSPGGLVLFWSLAAAGSLLFSLGDHLPGLRALAGLPGFDLLRVPARALFLTGLALAALAALAVHRLWDLQPSQRRPVFRLLAGISTFAAALAGGVWALSGKLPSNFAWGAGLVLIGSIWIGLRIVGKLRAVLWFLGLLVLGSLDLLALDRTLFTSRLAEQVLSEDQALADFLSQQPGLFRVYSPSYSVAQQAAARAGLVLADGVDPLQLTAYTGFMERATGIPRDGYSVTLPPMAGGEPEGDNVPFRPDPRLLGLLNVRYISAEYDLPVTGLVLRRRFGATRIYENLFSLPRAWLQPIAAEPGETYLEAGVLYRSPDRIEVSLPDRPAGGPSLLVLSELSYPGWQVRINGRRSEILTVAGLLRGVVVEPGDQRVEFLFRPASLTLGLILAVAGAAWFSIAAVSIRRNTSGLSRSAPAGSAWRDE